MANNRLLVVEPNGCNNEIPNPEDLTIYVELTATRRNRSFITNEGGSNFIIGNANNSSDSSQLVAFLEGSTINSNRRSLTTNFTEVNTNFSVNGETDLEALGIESINITFDTAYTPLITIKFIDIRGHSILSQGSNSKYNMFFELPFPIFELTIKGYYGKAVTYCLHLTKWNSAFNSSTGNFEITANFIGYTYAMLTDCIIGLIRACKFTEIGEKIFDRYKSEYPDLIDVEQFLDYVEKINQELESIKKDDENIKQYNALNDYKDELSRLRNRVENIKKTILSNNNKEDLLNNKVKNVIIVSNNNGINKDVIEFNKNIKKDSDEINRKIGDLSQLKLKFSQDKPIINVTLTNSDLKDTDSLKKKTKISSELIRKEIIDNFKNSENGKEVILYGFYLVIEELDRLDNEIDKQIEVIKNNINRILITKINKASSFKPTIKNIIDILAIHSQVFLETLQTVSINAENNKKRQDNLQNLGKENFNDYNNNNNTTIFPWPEYKEKNSDNEYYEEWLGNAKKLTESERNEIDEIKFVEELLDKLIKIGKNDVFRENFGGAIKGYYPVSPLELPLRIYNKEQLIDKNPYYNAMKSNKSAFKPDEAIRCLVLRGFLGLGLTNPPNSQKRYELAVIMGKLEAENLFDFLTPFDKKEDIFNNIKNLKYNDIRTKILNGFGKLRNPNNNKNGVIAEERTFEQSQYPYYFTGKINCFKYKYLSDLIGPRTDIIPVNGNFDGQIFTNEKFLKSQTDLSDLVTNDTVLFTGKSKNKEDNGIVYLKIVDEYTSIRNSFVPTYGSNILTKYNEKNNKLITQDTLKSATYNNTLITNYLNT